MPRHLADASDVHKAMSEDAKERLQKSQQSLLRQSFASLERGGHERHGHLKVVVCAVEPTLHPCAQLGCGRRGLRGPMEFAGSGAG